MLPLKGTRLVAKAYDPLYFNDEGYLNPFLCMDKYYTHEANAYMVLIELQGQWIPEILCVLLLPRVVFIDFAHALFNRRRGDPIPSELNDFLGEYISPLLRWNKSKDRDYAFLEWSDWDWDPWLNAEFAHTAASITPEMRERWSDD
jgi:hypothetical protein